MHRYSTNIKWFLISFLIILGVGYLVTRNLLYSLIVSSIVSIGTGFLIPVFLETVNPAKIKGAYIEASRRNMNRFWAVFGILLLIIATIGVLDYLKLNS
ncbi:MAG: hypothetical protein CMP48_06525 [Rickettsiales bacterium]|nr:hypothetical protein [Rickettsiales bacterium]